ncbi:MAG: hypothetical protein HY220_02705 [Candidatus Sungbacteria bacterium]|uniref:Uncharacterized protein n=1 Tax=Candidatus Sungiibacteriota bacterium TaxID=2750080 RepID=A0A9D6LT61_9BACT|nr:hypothetical protein [Candidatus Sungbacteria bacterium]
MPSFLVSATPHFERLLRALIKRNPEVKGIYVRAIGILETDPYNQTHHYAIKKLIDIPQGEGRWRLSLGRLRFRYDIKDRGVSFHYCGLRREDTYA